MTGPAPRPRVPWQPDWPDLVMRRAHLSDLPPIAPPRGYSVRSFQPGDGARWSAIVDDAFGRWEPHDFEEMIGRDARFAAERVWFACTDAAAAVEAVGTATAWREPRFEPAVGYLHMVGVCAAHQGLGLGAQLSVAVLHRFAAEGASGAVLETQDFRLAAIRTYLRLGFEPEPADDDQRLRWTAVSEALA